MKRTTLLPIFLVIQILFLKIISLYPLAVERFYSNGVYVWTSKILRHTLGKIPFSVGDVLYGIVLFFFLKSLWNLRKTYKTDWKLNALKGLSILSVIYFLFHLVWGLNYYRQPLFEKMSIKTEYTNDDLLVFTKKLIQRTNKIHSKIAQNDSSKVVYPYSQEATFTLAYKGYQKLANELPYFKYENRSVKKSLLSLPLTYMGFGGYLNPFTIEAQVNDMLPMHQLPMTSCHEMAHQIGFASESECNFIGFLATTNNDNLYIKYSGYTAALRYCLGNWYIRDQKVYELLLKTINKGVLKNYQESEDFWQEYETIIERGFHAFYDQFLKINQQQDGLNSYSKFVDLMVNYYKNKPL